MSRRIALWTAFWLAATISAASADNFAPPPSAPKTYQLNASAPDLPVSDTLYRYLSDQGARAYSQRRYKDAEKLYSTALSDADRRRARPGEIAVLAANLAAVYRDDGKYDQAKLLFKRALTAAERSSGRDSVYQYVLRQYAVFLARIGKHEEATFTAEAARLGHKLQTTPGKLKPQAGMFEHPILPVLSVHPDPPFALPVRNPNDPYWDVTQPLPPVLSVSSRPWTFQLHFAECPPRERWAAFDAEQKSALNHQWHDWLQQFRKAMEDAISGSVSAPNDGRYHLVVNRSGHIDDVEVLSSPREQDEYLQSIGGTISVMNTGKSVPFPDESQMEAIHVMLKFDHPNQKKKEEEEIDWSQFKPVVTSGWTTIFPIAGGRWGWYGHPAGLPGAGGAAQLPGTVSASAGATAPNSTQPAGVPAIFQTGGQVGGVPATQSYTGQPAAQAYTGQSTAQTAQTAIINALQGQSMSSAKVRSRSSK